jgi:uncharacterized membrane protein required for colicin V production
VNPWRDRALGIFLGIVLGLAIVAVFVFVFSEDTVDAPSIDQAQPAEEQNR